MRHAISRKIFWTFSALLLAAQTASAEEKLLDLSLEELITLEVTSVAKKPQTPHEAAAAITVLTSEDIRESGATSLTDALRLAPGVEVTEIDGNITAVSIRGFNWRFSNKLLLLVDGRAIYQPSVSGVFWDQQIVPLHDIQRIEIVRGPGATMWGANAMNGVINIVTKHAADTINGRVTVEAGTDDRYHGDATYGFQLGDIGAARIYASSHKLPSLVDPDGKNFNDGSTNLAVGFRADIEPSHGSDSFTLQGEIFTLEAENTIVSDYQGGSLISETQTNKGTSFNLLGRWVHTFSPDNALTLQAYIDEIDRSEFGTNFNVRTYDLDFSHRFKASERLDFVWGLNTHRAEDEVYSDVGFNFSPATSTNNWTSGFIQGEFNSFDDRLRLTLGSKFEENSFTGFEVQPSVRAIWLDDNDWAVWTAYSKAVRTPSRIETHLSTTLSEIEAFTDQNPGPLPVSVNLRGDPDFDAETMTALEAGFRKAWQDDSTLEISVFRHDYDQLVQTVRQDPVIVFAPVGPGGMPLPVRIDQNLLLQNGNDAVLSGIELSYDRDMTDWWSIRFAGNSMDIDLKANGSDPTRAGGIEFSGDAPLWQVSLLSTFDISEDVDASIWLRRVSAFDNDLVGAYTDADARITWRVNDRLELSLLGDNLIDPVRKEADAKFYPVANNHVERRLRIRLGMRF